MGSASRINVAIVGGGISGICTAIGLQKYPHINATIYEAAERFSEIGAGVLLGPNAKRALNLISPQAHQYFEELQTGNMDPKHKYTWYEFRYSTGPRAGEELVKVQNEMGQSSIHRAKFLDSLLRLVPADICRLGKRLESIEQSIEGVELRFADGSSAQAHCVIGADGIKSQVRRTLFKDDWQKYEPQFSGVVAFRGLIPMAEAQKVMGDELPRNSFTHCGTNSVISSFPIDFGETFNIVACRTDYKSWDGPWVQSTNFDEVEEVFQHLSPKVWPLVKVRRPSRRLKHILPLVQRLTR